MAQEDPAVSRFREYLRIKSVHPNPDYASCINFVKKQAEELDLEYHLLEFPDPAEFVVWLTWRGSSPDLKSIMLNSHMDVVPVDESKWKCDAFSAYKDPDGNIYGRGTQDMKSVGMQYLEAIRRLKSKGFNPQRTIHVTFVPDEELGSEKGMAQFIKTKEFKSLNVGFGLDEAGACPGEPFLLFNAERALWQIQITIKGNTGHALHFIENTAAEKAQKVINSFLKFRDDENQRLGVENTTLRLGEVTTVNMTMIQGGLQPNVIPPEISITFDLRISPKWSQQGAEKLIDDICSQAGSDISYKFIQKGKLLPETPLTLENPWWTAFKEACDGMNVKLLPMVCPGATDARFLRQCEIPAFGFMPINNTPILLHDNNEYLNENVFLKGIEIYEVLIQRLSCVPQ